MAEWRAIAVMIISIQDMIDSAADYFRYFASSPEAGAWGVEMTACGRTVIEPGACYPPSGHPVGHHFDWHAGRVLEALQVVWIRDGRGVVELGRGRREEVSGGMVFAVPPGCWHRYRPAEETGWTESWLEVRGSLVESLLERGEFGLDRCFRRGVEVPGMEVVVEAVHARARLAGPGFSPFLAALAMGVLAQWVSGEAEAATPLHRAVLAAERELAAKFAGPIDLEGLARSRGVAYSHFRRAFKAHTGFAPWQYVIHLRLSHARRLLAGTTMTLDEMALLLGFSSAFHLSAAFKKAFGIAPDPWRRRLRDAGGE
jgi:AraC-like DNA-binding protein